MSSARARGPWKIRRGTLEDEARLRDLCVAAVGPDDYVLSILHHVLAKETTLLAFEGPRLVGSMTYRELPDASGWLAAARTHPDARKRGVSTALVATCERLARRRGVGPLRLWTNATNASGVAAFRKAGFREIARFARLGRPSEPRGPAPGVETASYAHDLARRVAASPPVRAGAGFVNHDYAFLRLRPAALRSLCRRRALRTWGRRAALVTDVSETFDARVIDVTPVLGTFRGVLGDAPRIAASLGKDRVETFLPRRPEVLRTALDLGYRPMSWGDEAILCEKPVLRNRHIR